MSLTSAIRSIPVAYGLGLPLLVVALDQATKWAATRLFGLPMNICAIDPDIARAGHHFEVSPILDISMFCNQGISWGLLQGDSPVKRWALFLFAAVMVVVLYSVLASTKDRLSRLSLALLIGGAVGNAIDRALFGAVTDFANASDIGFNYVFNVADAAITVGITGLIVAMLLEWRADRASARS
ncbi:MAG: signal peptidase II [Litorimonas sp.]